MSKWPCPVCGRPTMRATCQRCQRREFVTEALHPEALPDAQNRPQEPRTGVAGSDPSPEPPTGAQSNDPEDVRTRQNKGFLTSRGGQKVRP